MTYHAITPFRRPMDAVRIHRHATLMQPAPGESVSKWAILRDLVTGREAFGVSDRDLTVLQALISFYPGNDLDDPARLIVYPSNATICERLNGMACSTMRRHLARLVEAGLILRNDSPNGKRYMRRSAFGEQRFGFDLSPLSQRAGEIRAAAQRARDTAAMIADLRGDISLMRRDVIGLLDLAETQGGALPRSGQYRDLVAFAARTLRRRLGVAELSALRSEFAAVLQDIQAGIPGCQTDDPSIKNDQNEQHHQRSDKEDSESECIEEKGVCSPRSGQPESLTLAGLMSACSDIAQFSSHDINDWPSLIHAAEQVRPLMGIEPSVWSRAKQEMGVASAAAALAAILQRFSQIRSPGAYLQALASRAEAGQFSIEGMIAALARRTGPEFTAVNC
ncbi:plasmid replication protein RepC [Paracoccus sp. SSK6]|uniref:plasmid replication protein RepC n=1 Tax=Paracoccus sp. SSK6 TaxID=3143131 RepID=UPI00321C1369